MNKFKHLLKVTAVTVILIILYVVWTHTVYTGNIIIIAITAFLVSFFFVGSEKLPALSFKKVAYSITYIGYMFIAIIQATLDVARRVIKKKIPLNPGIVKVKTHLKSKAGRMILANSITLTPGTLTVDVVDDYYYIHWIDITAMDVEGASEEIVAGFEKYLEVIFG